jgi:hypothetical protein
MNFAAAAAGNGRLAAIGPVGEKSEYERSDVRLWHYPEVLTYARHGGYRRQTDPTENQRFGRV